MTPFEQETHIHYRYISTFTTFTTFTTYNFSVYAMMLIKNRRRKIVNGIYSNRKRWAELMFQFIVFIKLQRGVAYTAQKIKFSIKDFFSKCDQIRRKLLVTFTEEILNGKLHFLFCDMPELGFSMNWIFPCKDRIFFI